MILLFIFRLYFLFWKYHCISDKYPIYLQRNSNLQKKTLLNGIFLFCGRSRPTVGYLSAYWCKTKWCMIDLMRCAHVKAIDDNLKVFGVLLSCWAVFLSMLILCKSVNYKERRVQTKKHKYWKSKHLMGRGIYFFAQTKSFEEFL